MRCTIPLSPSWFRARRLISDASTFEAQLSEALSADPLLRVRTRIKVEIAEAGLLWRPFLILSGTVAEDSQRERAEILARGRAGNAVWLLNGIVVCAGVSV